MRRAGELLADVEQPRVGDEPHLHDLSLFCEPSRCTPYIVKRTQLYLDEDMAQLLAAESRRRGTTLSWLVRDAVAKQYGRARARNHAAIIERLAGVWIDRDDLGPTDAFVHALRRSRRAERWAGGGGGKVPARQRRRHRLAAPR